MSKVKNIENHNVENKNNTSVDTLILILYFRYFSRSTCFSFSQSRVNHKDTIVPNIQIGNSVEFEIEIRIDDENFPFPFSL